MTATTTHRAREVWRYETHHRSKPVLATITPEGQIPTVAQLDQFHTGGILATAELASRGLLRERHCHVDGWNSKRSDLS